ncbi:FtsX-like permease family protein [Spiribacter vilamensis]|uniref:Putative ABC transport system permease protein n=1 Tax=Spiribacter vilamensis TaxID=531306 RepID=A0A4Q8D1H0_9GAMM|nr:FtsX-like permease family protein [Spiribacter vilamensis]RZU99154.1 putative ABC transport system permease protein [Spiribacter vilamensis]TVO61855.1 FtsX-like permease family protein [Spiribacter vilamensis]
MNRLIGRIGRADLRRHPLQTGLAMLGVAIAVAVVVAVDLANHSAREAMRVSLESVTGSATHQIVAGPEGVDERLYPRLRTEQGLRQAAPIVQGGVVRADDTRRSLTLLGVDAFAEGGFQRPLGGANDLGDAFNALMLRDDAVVVGRGEAERLAVESGDSMDLLINGERRQVTVVSVVDDPDDQARGLLLTDIAAAQQLLGQLGRLDRIDLIMDDARAQALANDLGDGVRIVPAAASAQSVLQMSQAFHINLTALSLLAVVVGAFLVFNTLSFLGVRRRATIGILRAMGVQRREIMGQMLGDALFIGIIGTLAGLGLGFALAHGLVGLVLQTVNDVYFERAAGELMLSPWSLVAGLLVGLVGSVVAALAPAREAAATPPRAALSRADLEQRARQLARRGGIAGGITLVAGALVIALSEGLVPAFVGLFALILGAAFLAPVIILGVGAALRPLMRGRPVGSLIVEGAVASLSRTGVAVAALSVAVAAVIGVAVMIASFRASVVDWLEGSLAADFYISAPATLADAEADRLGALNGVDFVSRSQWYDLPTADGPVTIWALELPAERAPQVDIRRPEPATALDAYATDQAVLISEPFAARRSLAPGDTLTLPVGSESVDLEVAGVYRDYASPTGAVLMRRALYRDLYEDDGLAGIGVHVTDAADRDALIPQLEQSLAGVPGARVTDNAAVLEQSLRIFDRTFAITEVLRWLAGLVAFVGVISALMALQLDRLREFAMLRAVGLSRGGLAGLIGGQSGLLGLIAGLWAVPLGVLLAGLLVFVINRRAYGWTMGFELQVGPVVEGVLLAVVAALLATLYPAWRATRLQIAAGLKGE